jgi:hypothetical protein
MAYKSKKSQTLSVAKDLRSSLRVNSALRLAQGAEVRIVTLSLGERVVRQLTDSEPGEGLLGDVGLSDASSPSK